MRVPCSKPERLHCCVRCALVLVCAFAFGAAAGVAQGAPGPPGAGGPGHGGAPFGNQNQLVAGREYGAPPNVPSNGNAGAQSLIEGGLQLGPPGRWWNDKQFAKSVGLDSGQQHRMDSAFNANKGNLIALYKNLKHEESTLDKMTRAAVIDEAQIDQEIDRVVQARGELEKANAHMLLQIRNEMTPEQIASLEKHRPDAP